MLFINIYLLVVLFNQIKQTQREFYCQCSAIGIGILVESINLEIVWVGVYNIRYTSSQPISKFISTGLYLYLLVIVATAFGWVGLR